MSLPSVSRTVPALVSQRQHAAHRAICAQRSILKKMKPLQQELQNTTRMWGDCKGRGCQGQTRSRRELIKRNDRAADSIDLFSIGRTSASHFVTLATNMYTFTCTRRKSQPFACRSEQKAYTPVKNDGMSLIYSAVARPWVCAIRDRTVTHCF